LVSAAETHLRLSFDENAWRGKLFREKDFPRAPFQKAFNLVSFSHSQNFPLLGIILV